MRSLISILLLAACTAQAIQIRKESERKKAPDFALKNSQNQVVKLSDYTGKLVLIDFWATWCGPCKSEIPWLNELSRKYSGDGLVVLGISMDEDGWGAVKPFLEKNPIEYPVLMGTRRAAYLYGDVEALPLAFFIDRDQRVAAIHSGAASRKDFEKVIQSLLNASR